MSVLFADIDATCAALGYSDGVKYHVEPDAIQGLKHLIWILRHDLDNHEYRRYLGRSKVVKTDLVYMLADHIEDKEFADVLIRLLVILTSPTLLLYRDGPPKDGYGRKLFMELIDILQGYKSAFTTERTWTPLSEKLRKVLEINWAIRSEEQGLLVERILVLIRNVLQVPANPQAECRTDNDASLHDQVIWALHQSGILDILLFVVSSSDENQYHLHGLEILSLLFREQTAESLADTSLQRSTSEKHRDEQQLVAARRREKENLTAKPTLGRHSRFGGTYVIQNFKSVSDRDTICHQSLERAISIDFDRQKEKQKKSHRVVQEESQSTRRSAFSVRLCLREYCIEILRSAYNTLVRQVKLSLEHNAGSSNHDDSYLLWVVRFFMEFNRLNGLQLQLISESLSVQFFHWVLTRMQHNMDMISSDKKQARLWAKRLHVSLQTFRELLLSLLALQTVQDEKARALFDMLLNNVCYVMEYRETILHLLLNYNEAHSTKSFLRDVIETANVFIKMMEKFCKSSAVVQDKHRAKRKFSRKNSKKSQTKQIPEEHIEQLENKWAELAPSIADILSRAEILTDQEQPRPFDAASDKHIDDQKEDCMLRIHKHLRKQQLEEAISLIRVAREVWPEDACFGAIKTAPEEELLLLREIFLYNLSSDKDNACQSEDMEDGQVQDHSDSGDADDIDEENGNDDVVETTLHFDDFVKRLLNPKIVRACTIVLAEWEHIATKSLKSAVTVLHRIAYGCSCPAMLYQASLFKIFQKVLNASRDAHTNELRRLAVYIIRKFVETAPSNQKIYAELFFYKTIKEANELESGYCDFYEGGTKAAWTEEQETELRLLFEENQRNPESDKDVIDWILDNLIDKKRTRRGVLKKLKEMSLIFKAPTKKSTAAASKNLWRHEEDDELRSLYDEHRLEADCLERIVETFNDRRDKNAIIKRMLQLHIIADKSEIIPKKQKKKRPTAKPSEEIDLENISTEKDWRTVGNSKKKYAMNEKVITKRKNQAPLDVAKLRSLLAQIGDDTFQEAISWLKESLEDAAADVEDPSEEVDGIPLVPLQAAQRDAIENPDFQDILSILGFQQPIAEMETYWRIPSNLSSKDLLLRSKIIAGERISEADEVESENLEGGDCLLVTGNDSDEEQDYLETYVQKRWREMNSLMFTRSDDEDENRQPPKSSMDKETTDGSNGKSKNKKIDIETVIATDEGDDEDDLNFNSEVFRQRLAELGDKGSDEDNKEPEINENRTETKISTIASKKRDRFRRINVTDSDSDSEVGDLVAEFSKTATEKNLIIKRRHQSDNERFESKSEGDDDDDENFIKRRKPTVTNNSIAATIERPPKRRCFAVIDDDEDD